MSTAMVFTCSVCERASNVIGSTSSFVYGLRCGGCCVQQVCPTGCPKSHQTGRAAVCDGAGARAGDHRLAVVGQQLVNNLDNQGVRKSAALQIAVQAATLHCWLKPAQMAHLPVSGLLSVVALVVVSQLLLDHSLGGFPIHARLSDLTENGPLAQVLAAGQAPGHLPGELFVIDLPLGLELFDNPLD